MATTVWTFECGHCLTQIHSHPYTTFSSSEHALDLCPACNLHTANVNHMRHKDAQDLAFYKEQYKRLSTEIENAKTQANMAQLNEVLETWKDKLLATAESNKDPRSKELEDKLINRYEEVEENVEMLVRLEKIELRQMEQNVEYEDCEYNVEGKWKVCLSHEAEIVASDLILVEMKKQLLEGLERADDQLKAWKREFDVGEEGIVSFEDAVEGWWGWVLEMMRKRNAVDRVESKA